MPTGAVGSEGQPQENTVERAYGHIRDRTVGFGYRPGERINESEVATELGMSRAPVREAMNRLVVDGLVEFVQRRGFFCRKLSAREVSELYAVRADLEVAAVRRAAAGADADALAAVVSGWESVTAQREAMTIEALVAADERFHLDLVELAGNQERLRYLRNINARIRFVRHINLEDLGRRDASLGEHAPILDAVRAGDVDEAGVRMERHLAMSSDEVMRHVKTGLARIYANEVA